MVKAIFCRTIQTSKAWRERKPNFEFKEVMLGGSIVDDLGNIKGTALWMTGV
ncbi:MAG TPA: hypothetical protein VGM64_00245 [Lacunisphaera sp.]|jgi:hypothetical protein